MLIVQAPNHVLSAIAKPVAKVDDEIRSLIAEMKTTLSSQKDPEGVGLAAPQVGRSLELFIIKPSKSAPFSVFINVKMVILEKEKQRKNKKGNAKLEGCLSIRDVWGTVKRSQKIAVTYMNEDGKVLTKTFSGWPATIIQHEYDHLQGILFPRHVLEQRGKLYKTHKDEKGEDIFERIDL